MPQHAPGRFHVAYLYALPYRKRTANAQLAYICGLILHILAQEKATRNIVVFFL